MQSSGAPQSMCSKGDLCRFVLPIYSMSSTTSFLTPNLTEDDELASPRVNSSSWIWHQLADYTIGRVPGHANAVYPVPGYSMMGCGVSMLSSARPFIRLSRPKLPLPPSSKLPLRPQLRGCRLRNAPTAPR